MNAAVSARGQTDPEHDRQASDLIFQGHSLADQLLARANKRPERMSQRSDFTCTGLKNPVQAKCTALEHVIAIALVGLHSDPSACGPAGSLHRLRADPVGAARETGLIAITSRLSRTRSDDNSVLSPNSPATTYAVGLSLAPANHHAFAIENANKRLIHRDIGASKIVHVRISSSTSWPIVPAFAEELPPHYPMLKNSEIEAPRKSHFRAESVACTGS